MRALAERRRFIPPALLDGDGWDRLLARVRDLPSEALEYCGFEFRLYTAEPAADMFVAAFPDSPVGRHLIRAGDAPSAPAPATALARHLRQLADADSPLHGTIETTGLEYDVAETPVGECPPPGVFFKLRLAEGVPRCGKLQRLPIATLANAVGWDDDVEERHAVSRALTALPSGGVVGYLGAMPGRAPRGIRLIVGGIGHDEVAATLEGLGWRGSASAAQDLLAELRDPLPSFRLAVDVASRGVSPHIGFELYPHAGPGQLESWLETTRKDWQPVVEELTRRGWCVTEKAHGLFEWCSQERIYRPDGMFLLHKGLNHLKLTLTAGDAENATVKAYGGMLFSRLK